MVWGHGNPHTLFFAEKKMSHWRTRQPLSREEWGDFVAFLGNGNYRANLTLDDERNLHLDWVDAEAERSQIIKDVIEKGEMAIKARAAIEAYDLAMASSGVGMSAREICKELAADTMSLNELGHIYAALTDAARRHNGWLTSTFGKKANE